MPHVIHGGGPVRSFKARFHLAGFKTKNIFLYNKMNTDIKQGSQDHPNESSYPIATVIDKGLYEIYNSPIYRRIYKSSKFVYNLRKSDQNSSIQNISPENLPELDFNFTPSDQYVDMT